MKKRAAWSVLLEGGVSGLVGLGSLALAGVLQAAPLPDVVIANADDAQAFADDEAFVFAGQTLTVMTGLDTDRPFRLEKLAPVIVQPGVSFELNGGVSAGGPPAGAPLEKRGGGLLALTGKNVYTSNTVLREGTLRVGGDSALGSALYTLEQHAGTVLQFEPGARLANMIQVTDTRPGDLALAGLEGRAAWRVESGTATLSNNINTLVPLHKTGEGSLRVLGAVQTGRPFFIDQGALVVDGLVTGRVEVGPGGRLEGGGELAAAHVHAGAMVAPGGRDEVGTLSSWGNFVFEPGSLYHVNAHADGNADRLELVGEARLDGDVWAEAGAGEWQAANRYRILTAQGGLDDTRFAGVDSHLA
ncbi:MAG: hypothetical protein WCX93_09600, partial [Burkholderiaceae bacterium]